jgi:small-conductance mechanosensitive channel
VEVGGAVYEDVLEVDIMFTRIKTIKKEIVHVPNSQILGKKIVNYSALEKPIVHYRVTIGYDAPRELVERLLLAASSRTDGLLQEPKSFVLMRKLDNYHGSYEINAYSDQPNQLVTIYSNLMKNILDVFDESGVEILSAKHVAVRESGANVKQRQESQGSK